MSSFLAETSFSYETLGEIPEEKVLGDGFLLRRVCEFGQEFLSLSAEFQAANARGYPAHHAQSSRMSGIDLTMRHEVKHVAGSRWPRMENAPLRDSMEAAFAATPSLQKPIQAKVGGPDNIEVRPLLRIRERLHGGTRVDFRLFVVLGLLTVGRDQVQTEHVRTMRQLAGGANAEREKSLREWVPGVPLARVEKGPGAMDTVERCLELIAQRQMHVVLSPAQVCGVTSHRRYGYGSKIREFEK